MSISRLTRFLFWTAIATATIFGLFTINAKFIHLPVGPSQKSWAHDVVLKGDPGIKWVQMVFGIAAMFVFLLLKLVERTYNWLRQRSNAALNPHRRILFWMVLFVPGFSQAPVIILAHSIKDFSIDSALVEIGVTLFIALLTLCPLLGLSATYDWAAGQDDAERR
jgi:uncharacterized membrane protein YhaH (DUF805 family)